MTYRSKNQLQIIQSREITTHIIYYFNMDQLPLNLQPYIESHPSINVTKLRRNHI